MDLNWLWVPQRIQYKLCVLMYGWLNGTARGYLSDLTVSVGNAARRQLRSASTSDLVLPPTRRTSTGDRAFAVAGPRAWNSPTPALCLTSKSFSTSKKNLNPVFLDCHFVRDSVHWLLLTLLKINGKLTLNLILSLSLMPYIIPYGQR